MIEPEFWLGLLFPPNPQRSPRHVHLVWAGTKSAEGRDPGIRTLRQPGIAVRPHAVQKALHRRRRWDALCVLDIHFILEKRSKIDVDPEPYTFFAIFGEDRPG